MSNIEAGSVVKYKDQIYLYLGTTSNGSARLAVASVREHKGAKHLNMFSGTPSLDKLEPIKTLPKKEFNGNEYVQTKLGVVSLSTGLLPVQGNILELFK